MHTAFIGQTGVRTSALVLGTMGFGGDADADTSFAILDAAREAGINHFDTANVYNQGASEKILGEYFQKRKIPRDEFLVATKIYFPTGTHPNSRGSSRLHLRHAVSASLTRLGMSYVDILYLHRFDACTHLEETLRGVDDLVRSGTVLYPAVSNFSAWQSAKALGIARAHSWHPIVAMQPMYNLFKRQAEVELLPMAQAENLGVFPYSPLAGGLLSGKYQDQTADGRFRHNKLYQTRYDLPRASNIASAFCEVAKQYGHHPVSLAIAWVGAHPAVTAPIIGARSPDQLRHCLAATEIKLTEELRQTISELTPTPPPATDRSEENSPNNFGAR